MLNITMIAYDNCLLSGLAGFLDLFMLGNWEYRKQNPLSRNAFCRVEVVTADGTPATSFCRLAVIPKCSLQGCQDADLVLIPGIMGRPEQLLEQRALIDWVRQQHERGALIASACSGAFLLAASGILKGRAATTHWQLAERFRKQFPDVELQINRLIIDGGDYVCAGGGSAHFDLAHYLLEKLGSEQLASACAGTMLLDHNRRDQAPYLRFRGTKSHGDKPILKAQQWLDANYRNKINVREMAECSGLNERTFLRRFRKATGEAPLVYLQRMRIEAAKEMLSDPEESLEHITRCVGYEDVSSFRRLFKEIVGISPAVYRHRFGSQ